MEIFRDLIFFCLTFFLFRFISTTKQLTKGTTYETKTIVYDGVCFFLFLNVGFCITIFSRLFAMNLLHSLQFWCMWWSSVEVLNCGILLYFACFSLIFTIHLWVCIMFICLFLCMCVRVCLRVFVISTWWLFSFFAMGKSKITKNKNDSIQVCECVGVCLFRFF